MPATGAAYATPFGTFNLHCYPPYPRDTRQPWNAADTLLLEAHAERALDTRDTLVVNDSQGALGVALAAAGTWSDSAVAVRALRGNESANDRKPMPVTWCDAPPPQASTVVLRVPKHLSLLRYQLWHLARRLQPGSQLLAAGMDKHLSPHTAATLEAFFGVTERHHGRHKARLFTAQLSREPLAAAHPNPPPPSRYTCTEAGGELLAMPGVFSEEQLDGGTRLLLRQLHRLAPVERMIDLAAGNGVLGLAARHRGIAQSVLFADESALALASARRNAETLFPASAASFDYLHDDGLQGYGGDPVPLILCNPPFHQDSHVSEDAGRHLLRQCGAHIAPGGALCVVANRHLKYRAMLAREFERVTRLDEDRRFVVWLCTKA